MHKYCMGYVCLLCFVFVCSISLSLYDSAAEKSSQNICVARFVAENKHQNTFQVLIVKTPKHADRSLSYEIVEYERKL